MRARSILIFLLALPAAGAAWAEQWPGNAEHPASAPAWSEGGFLFPEGETIENPRGGIGEFLRVAGSNFTPRDASTTFSYASSGCMQRNSNVGDSWFTTDLQVPDGATIDYLRVYYNDTDAGFDVHSELWAFDSAGGTTLIAEADSTGSGGFGSAGSGFFAHVVDNVAESLVIVASIQGGVGSALTLCGVRVRYQLP